MALGAMAPNRTIQFDEVGGGDGDVAGADRGQEFQAGLDLGEVFNLEEMAGGRDGRG